MFVPLDGQNNQIECRDVFDAAFPTLVNTPLQDASPTELCDREKRDIHYSDDITDEDFQLFSIHFMCITVSGGQ